MDNTNLSTSPLPEMAPAAPQETYTLDETRAGLDSLKKELSTAEGAGDIMKRFEHEHVDTSEWSKDPTAAIPTIERLFPDGENKKILLSALRQPETPQFDIGRKTILAIADSTGNRRKEIEKAKVALNGLQEDALVKNIKDGAVNLYKGVMRGDTTSIIIVTTALSALLWHIIRDDPKNTVLRPLAFGALGFVGANAATLAFSGKGITDYIDGFREGGVPFMPSAREELPVEMQRLGKKAGIDDASEFVALGRLGRYPMAQVYSSYDPSKKTIEPSLFGFSKEEISGERLYKVVDTMVKRHDNRKINGVRVGKPGDFKRDFADKHDYTFLETSYLLYEKDVNSAINLALNPEKRKEYFEKVESDTKKMFKDTPANPEFKNDMPVFYGVRFHVGPEDANPANPGYTYTLDDESSLTVHLNDSQADRLKQADQLKTMARNFIMARLEEKDPTAEALSSKLEYDASRKSWVFKNVMIDGALQDVVVEDESDSLAMSVKGKVIELGTFLKDQAVNAKNFTVEKGGQAKDYVVDKASKAYTYASEKTSQAGEFIGEKAGQVADYTSDKAGEVGDAVKKHL